MVKSEILSNHHLSSCYYSLSRGRYRAKTILFCYDDVEGSVGFCSFLVRCGVWWRKERCRAVGFFFEIDGRRDGPCEKCAKGAWPLPAGVTSVLCVCEGLPDGFPLFFLCLLPKGKTSVSERSWIRSCLAIIATAWSEKTSLNSGQSRIFSRCW